MRCFSMSQFGTLVLHAVTFCTAVFCSVEFGICFNRKAVPDLLSITLFSAAFLGQVILSTVHAMQTTELRDKSDALQNILMDASPVGPLDSWSLDISQPVFPEGELVFK